MSIQTRCYVIGSPRAFSPFFLRVFGLGAVFLDGRTASSSPCPAVAVPGFLRLRFMTSFGGGMALLDGEGRAIVVPVDPDGGPECGTGGGGSCFVFGVTGTEVNGDTVGF